MLCPQPVISVSVSALFLNIILEDCIGPAIQHRGYSHRRVCHAKCEPLGGLGHIPDGEDDERREVEGRGSTDGDRAGHPQVGGVVDGEDKEDAQRGTDGGQVVHGGGVVPAEALDPEQKRRRVGARVEEERVPEHEDPELPVPKDAGQQRPREGLAPHARALALQAGPRQLQLVRPHDQPIGPVRRAGPDEEAQQRDGQGDDGVDDEQPPPPGQAVVPVEVGRGGGLQEARGRGAQRQACVEGAAAPADLVAAVPGAKDKVHAGEVGGLKQRDHEAVGHDLAVALGAVLEQGEDAPAQVERGHQDVHGDAREEVGEGEEAEDVADEEDGLELHELVACEVEIG
ncbi:hypothetical protein OPQ81_005049 [Rhizoctonia solani]|nr:hypothetical protein OPQ81_005049 [Rhizoctonia solani]